jgi:hypothetical protein
MLSFLEPTTEHRIINVKANGDAGLPGDGESAGDQLADLVVGIAEGNLSQHEPESSTFGRVRAGSLCKSTTVCRRFAGGGAFA